MLKLVLISDTHGKMDKIDLPEGDITLHGGDHTFRGTIEEITKAMVSLKKKAQSKHIVVVPGNHDWLAEHNPALMKQICEDNGIILLNHESIELEGLKIFGSGFTPEFCNWALNVPRGEPLREKWAQIPDDTQVLITHGPPYGILDVVPYPKGHHAGCEELYRRIKELSDLRLHLFGHLHLSYGSVKIGDTDFVNASICTEEYRPDNKPIILSI